MTTQEPKISQDDKAKEKSATKTQEAADELVNLMTFNQSITHAMAIATWIF